MPLVKSLILIGLLYSPWLVAIVYQIMRSMSMWYFPVDGALLAAIFGNIYLGFEGTPPWFWGWSSCVALVIVSMISFLATRKDRPNIVTPLLLIIVLPLVTVIGISFIKPIFTLRYLIYTSVFEVLLISLSLAHIPRKNIRLGLYVLTILATFGFSLWYAPYHKKVDFKSTLHTINHEFGPGDIIVSVEPLSYFETVYYTDHPDQVYLLNPEWKTLPVYVGSVLIPPSRWIRVLPEHTKSFLVHDDGGYEVVTNE